jgi:hypothetical protein
MLWRSLGLRQLDQNNTTRRAQPCQLVCCQPSTLQDGVHNEEKSTSELSAAYSHHRAETSLAAPRAPAARMQPRVRAGGRLEWHDWPGPGLHLPAVRATARLRRLGMFVQPANDVLLERQRRCGRNLRRRLSSYGIFIGHRGLRQRVGRQSWQWCQEKR